MNNFLSGGKSIFQSQTFWNIVLTAAAGLIPLVVASIQEKKVTATTGGAMALIVVGAIRATAFRVSATETLYTPKGFPGPNKPDESQ